MAAQTTSPMALAGLLLATALAAGAAGYLAHTSLLRDGMTGGAGDAPATSPTAQPIPGGFPSDSARPLADASSQPGGCHMDRCSWSREVGRKVLGRSARGTLYQLSLLGGESAKNQPIKWAASPHAVWVFCSTSLPTVMTEDGHHRLETTLLPLRADGDLPGVLESDFALYAQTCHGVREPGNDAPAFAARFGYAALPDDTLDNAPLTAPADILGR
ncbi:hypothetical protein [Phenylobacterium sp.]|uniref:hypothetical protein n=1 Tax=Phenylobacterium sp. TaxID=1871053 RepID=UPI002BE988A1|nr:hypothetical protein [Phenylobacterium sp.]HLZ77154.1 hypothetical protein [Phenylobacterium sp.]